MIHSLKSGQKFTVWMYQVTSVAMEMMQLVLSQFLKNFAVVY